MEEHAWRTATHPYHPHDLLGWALPRLTLRQRLLFGAACLRRIWDLLADPRFRTVVEVAEDWADGANTEAEFNAAVGRVPRIANWRPPEPPPLPEPPREYRTFYLSVNPHTRDIPPGVLNFPQLPMWVRQTHYATTHLGALSLRGMCQAAADAQAGHAAEHAAGLEAIEEQIDAIRKEIDGVQREYDDALWRGMSAASDKAADLAQCREQADARVRQLRAEQEAIGHAAHAEVLRDEFAAQTDLLRCVTGNPYRPLVIDSTWRSETVIALARSIDIDRAYDRLPILADALEEAGCDDPHLLAHGRSVHHARGCHVVDAILNAAR